MISTMNIIYTEGIRCGLSVKFLFFRYKRITFRFPIWIIGYDREWGKRLQKRIEQVRKDWDV